MLVSRRSTGLRGADTPRIVTGLYRERNFHFSVAGPRDFLAARMIVNARQYRGNPYVSNSDRIYSPLKSHAGRADSRRACHDLFFRNAWFLPGGPGIGK